ncbi:MAG: apolipoprotein N-acyltransferase [Pseudomonadota bacterium]
MLVAAGAVAALGLAPFHWPIATLAALVFLIWHLEHVARTPRASAVAGFLFGLGYFALALQWIVQPFLVDAPRHGWMAPFALALMASGMALYWAFGLWAASRLAGRAGALAAVLGLSFAELLRSWLFGGFPWALLGSVWVDTPLRAAAAWGGVHALTLLTLGIAAGLASWSWRGAIWAAFCVALLGGAALIAPSAGDPGAEAIRVRLVQANATQHLKWREDMIPVFWQRRIDFSEAPAPEPPDVVIWPEVALPYLAGTNPEADRRIAEAAGVPVIAGAQRRMGETLFNSIIVLDRQGETAAVYDKHHLVPFGEYFPGGALAARLGLTGLATDALGMFSAGPGPQVLDLKDQGLGEVLALICYEAIFPRYGRAGNVRPDWIVQVTNDAWFGHFAGPQQHLDIARLRATELGLPLARAANTGISAVIGPTGEVIDQIDLNTAGYLDVSLPASLPPTLFTRIGNALTWGALAFVSFWLLATRRGNLGA